MDVTTGIENPEEFLNKLKFAVNFRLVNELQTLLLDSRATDQSVFWDTTQELTKCFTEEVLTENEDFYTACQKCMEYLIENGNHSNHKELLLILLEQSECFKDDVKFESLTKFIQQILLKLPSHRQESLLIALETTIAHIQSLPLPANHNLEGEERKLMDLDAAVVRSGHVMCVFLKFLKPFVWECARGNPHNVRDANCQQVDEITKHLLNVLDHPLCYANLSHTDESGMIARTNSRESAETIVAYLGMLHPDSYHLTHKMVKQNRKFQGDRDNVDKTVSDLGLSCFLYLVYGEQLGEENLPYIFSHVHIFKFLLPFMLRLLSKAEYIILHKGLYLSEDILEKLCDDSFDVHCVTDDNFSLFLTKLIDIMTVCNVTEMRQRSLKVMCTFIEKFTLDARYKIYMRILCTVKHAGVLGLIINMIKDEVDKALRRTDSLDRHPFIGQSLHRIVISAISLPDFESGDLPEGATVDLLDQSDRVIAALNLVRYLTIRDPATTNRTGFWSHIEEYTSTFIEPLRFELNMSQAHYELEMRNELDKAGISQNAPVVKVCGTPIPNMSQEQKIGVLRNALNTFDLITSIHARVEELIRQHGAMS